MNVSDLESNLDVYALLELWGVDTSTLRQVTADDWRSHCFIHGGTCVTSLSIRLHNGRYWITCYSRDCFAGTLVDYGITLGKSFADVLRDYEMCQCDGTRRTHTPHHTYTASGDILSPNVMEQFTPATHRDITSLGYDRQMLRDIWDVRYCADANHTLANRIVYPVRRRDGAIVSVQGRIVRQYESTQPKYQFLCGLSAKSVLYGAYENATRIRHSQFIVIGEGAKIAWRGYQLGISTLATLGIRYTTQQVTAIAAYGRRVICVADNDTPGIDGMARLADELRRYVDVRMAIVPDMGADLSDYTTIGEWMRILKGAK